MKNTRAYWEIVKAAARDDGTNVVKLTGSVVLGVARMLLIAAIYKAAYTATSGAQLPYANAVWSIGLYFTFIYSLGLRNVFKAVDQEVKTGVVEIGLIKPLEWRMVKVCELLGRNTVEFVCLSIAFIIALTLTVGVPHVSYLTISVVAGYAVLVLLGMVSSAALSLTIGLSAFWLNDAKSVFRIVDKLILVFGGAFVPIALLPDVLQTIVRYSPFGVFAASTQLFNPALPLHLVPTLFAAVVWAVILLAMCQWIWRKAEQRLEVNGG